MKKNKVKANKPKDENLHGIARGTLIIILVLVIIFCGVFYWMWSIDMLFLPSFIEDMLGEKEKNEDPVWNLGALSELVKNGKNADGEVVSVDVSYENLKEAFLTQQSGDGVYVTANVSYFSGDTEFSKKIVYYRDGERFRAEQYSIGNSADSAASEMELLKVSDGNELYTFDYASGESRYTPLGQDISPENEAGIPSVDKLLDVIENFPSREIADKTEEDAGITDTTLKLVRTEKGNVYYISFKYADIGLTEEYYVSLEDRLVIFALSTQNGKKVYAYELLDFSVDSKDYKDDGLYRMSKPN